MRILKLLEGLYQELKTYNENVAKNEKRHDMKTVVLSKKSSLPPEYNWIKLQLFTRGITHADISQKLGYSTGYISQVICGVRKNKDIQNGLTKMLGYQSWEQLLEEANAQSQTNKKKERQTKK